MEAPQLDGDDLAVPSSVCAPQPPCPPASYTWRHNPDAARREAGMAKPSHGRAVAKLRFQNMLDTERRLGRLQ